MTLIVKQLSAKSGKKIKINSNNIKDWFPFKAKDKIGVTIDSERRNLVFKPAPSWAGRRTPGFYTLQQTKWGECVIQISPNVLGVNIDNGEYTFVDLGNGEALLDIDGHAHNLPRPSSVLDVIGPSVLDSSKTLVKTNNPADAYDDLRIGLAMVNEAVGLLGLEKSLRITDDGRVIVEFGND